MKYYLIMISVLLISSCSNIDDTNTITDSHPPIPNNALTGYIVSNEGNFGTPNADLSLISEDFVSIQNNLYTSINGANLGDVLQNISFYADKAFIVLNNSNKIEVINRYTFEHVYTITEGLEQPRYSTILNQKLFVTNAISDKVNVYDIANYELLHTIQIDDDIERIVGAGDKIYIEKSYFGSGNSIEIYDIENSDFIDEIAFQGSLNSIEADENSQYLYALTSTEEQSNIYQISLASNTIQNEWNYTEYPNASKLRIERNRAYFISNGSVYYQNLSTENNTLINIITQDDADWSSFYGFEVIDDKVFVMDAQGFVAPGKVKVYTESGTFISEFTAGIGPNFIYKNY